MINNFLFNRTSTPPSTEYFLKRPHINELLENAIKKPLTTVIAGAGYGKTQSVSSYLESSGKKIIWFQLSELDNLAMRLWERIVYEFRIYNINLANNLKALGYPETKAAFDKFLYLLTETITNLKNFVIVFDDLHLINNNVVLNFLEKLIMSQIPNLSFVLISRTKPNLDLSPMFSKNLVGIITEDDLRFSKDEIRLYYQRQNLYLNEKLISDIYQNTEGWILAAYLVGLSLKKVSSDNLSFIAFVKVNIYELIEKEIFATASLELQHFLLEFAILDVVPKGLLKELPNYNDSLFSEMTKANLLMQYDSTSDHYRMHNLFRDFLLERKGTLTTEQIVNIYHIAAEWYEKNGYKSEAINYYEKCDNYNKIFDIILSDSRTVVRDIADLYIRLIDQAPKKLIEKQPIMLVVKAIYLINNNKIEQAADELAFLRKKYEALPEKAENKAILGETYIWLALISIIKQNYEFEELFNKSALCLPEGSALIDYRMNIADGINICGIKNPAAGELKKYYDAMFRTMPLASKVMKGCCSGAEYLNAADSYFMTGNIKEAEENAFKAVFHARKKLQYGIECMANFILLRIYVLKGDYTEASAILKQMQEPINILENSNLYQYDIVKGWFFVKISEINKVAEWIRHEEETKKMLPPVTIGREYLVRSDCFLAENRYVELLAYMELTDNLYAERGILYAIIQNKITKAIIYNYMSNYEGSINALTEAYELSNPNNLIIQYIEYGNQMKTLISAAKKNKNCKIPAEWLNKIYTESSSYAKQLLSIAKAYKEDNSIKKDKIILTRQEKEVLNCLDGGLTRVETADNLNLSVNTVKSILQNIYSKLGVSSSADAVRIAAEMNQFN